VSPATSVAELTHGPTCRPSPYTQIEDIIPPMPIYEYRCNECRKKVSILTLRVSAKVDERCEHCGSTRLTRLLSRFATTRSEESRLDSLADPSNLSGVDESGPRSMARWMRKMGKEMGEEFGGEEFDEMVDEMETGKMPDEGGGDLETADGGGDPSDD
jgi:putative FmdB family regulatory protein